MEAKEESVFEIEGTRLVKCNDKEIERVIIPDGVTKIASFAFYDFQKIKYVEIPSSVTEIESNAFQFCKSLEYVKILPGLKIIGYHAFGYCFELRCIELPSTIEEIEKKAFSSCSCLETIVLGDDFEKVPFKWFSSIPDKSQYKFVFKKESKTHKALKKSSCQRIRFHAFDLQQIEKDKKTQALQKTEVEAFLSSFLEGKPEGSFEILRHSITETVVIVRCLSNYAVFTLSANIAEWVDKLKVCIDSLSDASKKGEEIYQSIIDSKLPLGEIPFNKIEYFKEKAQRRFWGRTQKQTVDIPGLEIRANEKYLLRLFCTGAVGAIFPLDCGVVELFGVTAILNGAFSGNLLLTVIVIPATVTKIERDVFFLCKRLEYVIFGGTIEQWKSIEKDKYFFSRDEIDPIVSKINPIVAKNVRCIDGETKL